MRPRRFWDEIEQYLYREPRPKLLAPGVLRIPWRLKFHWWLATDRDARKRERSRLARARRGRRMAR